MKLRVTHKWNSNYSKTPLIGSTVNTAALDMTKVTDYIGNKVYEQGVLKKILVDGGYIEDGKYYFTLQDHLGNTRMVLSQDGSIVQREYYYPFGMTMPELENDNKYPYRYNGKELDQMHRLDLYDYSARYYDQAIGRFTTVDPLAEKYYSWSPYNYVGNNPIKRIDPTGMDWWTTSNQAEIERIMAALKSGETVGSQSLGDQWTRVEEISEHDYAIFDDESSDLTINGVSYKDFEGYGENNSGFGFLADIAGLWLASKEGTVTVFMQQSMDKNKYIRNNYYSIAYSNRVMSNKISLSKTRVNLGSLSKGLGILGGFSFGVSTISDFTDVYSNKKTPTEASFNFTSGAAALINPYFAVPYGLSEAFVPGGFKAVVKAYGETRLMHLEMNRKYWWYPVPIIH